jgi:hypothetical protein
MDISIKILHPGGSFRWAREIRLKEKGSYTPAGTFWIFSVFN